MIPYYYTHAPDNNNPCKPQLEREDVFKNTVIGEYTLGDWVKDLARRDCTKEYAPHPCHLNTNFCVVYENDGIWNAAFRQNGIVFACCEEFDKKWLEPRHLAWTIPSVP